jgi:DNA modification methylase
MMIRLLHGGVVNADSKNGNNDKRYSSTQKPISLMAEIMEALTNKNDVILDPFAGAGSTLLACEKTGRTCIAIEIVPENVSIILSRWEEETGNTACQV